MCGRRGGSIRAVVLLTTLAALAVVRGDQLAESLYDPTSGRANVQFVQ